MRLFVLSVPLLAFVGLAGCRPAGIVPEAAQALAAEVRADTEPALLTGKTQPAPGHKGVIAPVVLHPVIEVLVKVGDRVKKEQILIKIDDDEPQADVRGKQAALDELKAGVQRLKAQPRQEERAEARALLESAQVSAQGAQHVFERLEPLWKQGAISDQRYHDAQVVRARARADERAADARLARLLKHPVDLEIAEMQARVASAQASLEAAKAELEHYTVTAAIAGVVTALEVSPGTVSRPGTTVWGEILDLSVLDVRCDVTPQLADTVAFGQGAEVFRDERPETRLAGKVVYVGVAADPRTGRVPVLIRLENPEQRLRCYIDVKVRLVSK